ncbi:MAG: carbamoyltransferase [Deltaproteobacteria bacterium]|nr:carbamoyltransferase [Deltaproteobacteria bacterium]
MIILGLNAYHGNASAAIVVDGKLLAAVEEERFNRIKNWAGLPVESIKFCLNEAKILIDKVDHIAVNRNPKANISKKALFALSRKPPLRIIADRLKNASKIGDIKSELTSLFETNIKAQMHNIEHHIAHLASTFFVSPFDKAALLSVDGFGDFVGAMWGIGSENRINVKHRTFFPHSLGLFYLAFTQYLGFSNYGDEYKVMGLAPYGEPRFMNEMNKVIKINFSKDKPFELDLDYFIHHSKGVRMTWDKGIPEMGPVYSDKLISLFGPARQKGEELTQRHKDIAHSLQKRYEEAFFHILSQVYEKTKSKNLALSGGCAMNSVANGKIFEGTPFREVYIQPAAGDAGGAIGAAYYVWNQILGNKRSFVFEKPYVGPQFNDAQIEILINTKQDELEEFIIDKINDQALLCKKAAEEISKGKVTGWFQGRMEWGSRALGNRSILGDPRRMDMKDILNKKIKRRESFRPFAPSINIEATSEYFERSYPDPFMLKVYKVKESKRKIIPAVTHIDGSGRLQTVSKEINPLYWKLINEFRKITEVPVLLNTSFNENEPIVCKPDEALNCFLRTNMDVLVLGNYFIKRRQ